jgi:hypothetical protein
MKPPVYNPPPSNIMKTYRKILISAGLLLAGQSLHAQAITDFALDGNKTLTSIIVNGTTYTSGSLINSTVTSASHSASGSLVLTLQGATLPTPPSAVMADMNVASGLLNVTSATFTFNTPITNGTGLDLFIFDWGAFSSDTFKFTINGISSANLTTTSFPLSGYSYYTESLSGVGDIYANASVGYTTVAGLDDLTLTTSSTSSISIFGVIGIDLSNFGVATGASITQMTITSSNNSVDPTLVMGLASIPEPQTSAILMGIACGSISFLRRRRWC